MIRKLALTGISAVMVSGCGDGQIGSSATLYRNSPLDPAMRVHFASFNADESGDFNAQNCEMMARILNANVNESAAAEGKERNPSVGFWCESGAPSSEGPTPSSFESEFPSDVRSPLRF